MNIIARHSPTGQTSGHKIARIAANTAEVFRRFLRRCIRRFIAIVHALLRPPVTPIEEAQWHHATKPYVFVARLSREENRRLRLIAADFLSRKNITGAAGLVVTELLRLQIAAQACILILELGVDSYDGWNDIVVYPAAFRPRRTFTDAAGVVHNTTAILSGEAWLGGPVVLSHAAITQASDGDGDSDTRHGAHNVVIHEFAHKLDMRNGNANGFPPLHRGMQKLAWQQAFMAAYLDFCQRVDRASALAHTDGGAAWRTLPLDAYAAENPAEFFAVMSEAFFITPADLKTAYPAAYAQLVAFYRQNPLA